MKNLVSSTKHVLLAKKRRKETLRLWNFIKKRKILLKQKAQQLRWRKKIRAVEKSKMNLRKSEVEKEKKCLKVTQTKQTALRRE